jgi:2-(1,2-epoxy-1,2-dihydrophenyl)acetyl-CoA isomerase
MNIPTLATAALQSELQAGVLTLTLNRPEKRNAINNDLARALLAALQHAEADTAVRCVVLRGNGLAFCAGRDVSEAPTEDDLVLTQQVAQAIVRCSKPVVAAVHGWVVGAGLEWMLDADIVVATDTARFKLPEASLGVFVTGGISAILPAIAGVSRAKALMLLGEEFGAAQAHAWGLVWAVVSPDSLQDEARRCAQRLASMDASVVGHFKRVLNQVGLPAFEQAIQEEASVQRSLQAVPVAPLARPER